MTVPKVPRYVEDKCFARSECSLNQMMEPTFVFRICLQQVKILKIGNQKWGGGCVLRCASTIRYSPIGTSEKSNKLRWTSMRHNNHNMLMRFSLFSFHLNLVRGKKENALWVQFLLLFFNKKYFGYNCTRSDTLAHWLSVLTAQRASIRILGYFPSKS